MKPKNQGALVKLFLEGTTEGAIGTLLIHGRTLYNTEGDEFMPIARRIGPEDKNLTYIINVEENTRYHGMYSYHKKIVQDTIRDLNMVEMDEILALFIPMPTYSRPMNSHTFNTIQAIRVIKQHRETIDGLEDKVTNIENHTHIRSGYEDGYTDDELIAAAEIDMKNSIRIIKYLSEELEESEINQQMCDIEKMVRLPQILEDAIADGGMNAKDLHKIIETRDRVQKTLDTIEQYMAVILAIPSEPDDHKPKGEDLPEITVYQ